MLYVVMQALELMKTHVVKTTPYASLGEAVDLMDLYQVNGLPVVDEDEILCGMLTEDDVLRALKDVSSITTASARPQTKRADGGKELEVLEPEEPGPEAQAEFLLRAQAAAHLLVGDYMTQPAISISEHTPAHLAARDLLIRRLKRIPVTDEQGRVVGVLNRADVFQAIFEQTIQTSLEEVTELEEVKEAEAEE